MVQNVAPDQSETGASSAPLAQPIETAPRDEDGPDILVSSHGKVWFQAFWDDEDQRFYTFNQHAERDLAKWFPGKTFTPTMWIPLPTVDATSPPAPTAIQPLGSRQSLPANSRGDG